MRHPLVLITALLIALLFGGIVFPPETSAGAHVSIATRVGAQNPHVRHNAQFGWWECYGCHTANGIHTSQEADAPKEPCANCHLPLTAAQVQAMVNCRGPSCAMVINYHQRDGSMLSFPFGPVWWPR